MRHSRFLIGLAPLLAAAVLVSDPGASSGGQPSVPAALGPETILELPWGSGGLMLGRVDGNEAASFGPLSFAISDLSSLYILDQVNGRILKFYADGSAAREITLPAATFQDIGVAPSGQLVLLDKLATESLVILDEKIGVVRQVSILGQGIEEGGLVTAMFIEHDGVWLEVENAYLVKVLDGDLIPCGRVLHPGRTLDGGQTRIRIKVSKPSGDTRIWLQELGQGPITAGTDVALSHPIDRIITIEPDRQQNIYAAFHLMEVSPVEPFSTTFEQVEVLRYDRDLNVTGSFSSSYTLTEWMQFKEFMVGDDGSVYQMAFTGEGVKFLRWRWAP